MGGKVTVASELEIGSTFSMTFKVMYKLDEDIHESVSDENDN